MIKLTTLTLFLYISNAGVTFAEPENFPALKSAAGFSVIRISTEGPPDGYGYSNASKDHIIKNCPKLLSEEHASKISNRFIFHGFKLPINPRITEDEMLQRFGKYEIINSESEPAWLEPGQEPFDLVTETRNFKDITLVITTDDSNSNHKQYPYSVDKIILEKNNIALTMPIILDKTTKNDILCTFGLPHYERGNKIRYIEHKAEIIIYFDSNLTLVELDWEFDNMAD